MKTYHNLKISKKTLLAHRMRTILALMGIIIGVSAVIIMVAIGNGAKREVISRIEAMGTNLIVVNAGQIRTMTGRQQIRGTATTLTLENAENIKQKINEIVNTAPYQSKKLQVKYGNLSTNTTITGTMPEFTEIRNFNPEKGRFFNLQENKGSRRYAVIGSGVAKNLFENDTPLGKIIRIGRVPFEVIGIMESKGVDMNGVDQDDQIFIPIRTALRRVFNLSYVNSIYLQVDKEENIDEATAGVKQLLREKHRLIRKNKPDDFTIQSQTDLLDAQKEMADTFTMLIGSISGISLFIGGVGILAIMLLAVRERTNEIGLRMAVGACRKDILLQFLFESSILSLGGGIIGIIIGVMGATFTHLITTWQTYISMISILISFGFSLTIGLFFGVYPAYKASLLDPIEALKNE